MGSNRPSPQRAPTFLEVSRFHDPGETGRTSAGFLRTPAVTARCAPGASGPRLHGPRSPRLPARVPARDRSGSRPSLGFPARHPDGAWREGPLTRQARSRSKSRARRNRSRKASLSSHPASGAPAAPARRRSSARLGCSSGEFIIIIKENLIGRRNLRCQKVFKAHGEIKGSVNSGHCYTFFYRVS